MCFQPREAIVVNLLTLHFQVVDRAAQINRVSEDDRSYTSGQTAGPVALIFEALVANFTQTVKGYSPGQRILTSPRLVRSGRVDGVRCFAVTPG